MLSKAREKLVRSLHTTKGRRESGLCLVEGEKNVSEAGESIEFTFTVEETDFYKQLVDTVTPQPIAAVARIPQHDEAAITALPTIVVLDGVQDPGNVGSILRLCLAFKASLVLIESADPSSPKVIRSSAGAFFRVPWIDVPRGEAVDFIASLSRPIYRLETPKGSAAGLKEFSREKGAILIAGSEGQGIKLDIAGTPLTIAHESALESLNVAHAVAIALSSRYSS